MSSLPGDIERLLHDLRGPLNAATMHLEVLKRLASADPTAHSSLDAVQQELGRLTAMLTAAFAIVALECGERVAIDLGDLVRQTLEEQNLGPATVAESAWPKLHGDRRLVALAVTHLVRNALAATAAAGSDRRPPHVSFRAVGSGRIALVVRDWGQGLRTTNPRVLIRLTFSSSSGRPAVGLTTVERIARLHGGALEFFTPPEGGTEVCLTLPAV